MIVSVRPARRCPFLGFSVTPSSARAAGAVTSTVKSGTVRSGTVGNRTRAGAARLPGRWKGMVSPAGPGVGRNR
ncbi:hypothetical protein EBO15_10735 [Actinomadura harenae]|uniref:Uncharacterized protein n=1 Tax=Actinomadura harenae TaxID=2483351 RepID=A0A3M2M5L5_9ACTN|nr:hypothetical protein EBO15_10735 [Actinomadura harenae]